ncbi:MAG: response regulator [Gammaproteobacteria bacterium]|nr:response regulator [Gammaproteobacteria bacterium]
MTRRPELQTCTDEPIRVPGSIQPHGALLGIDEQSLEIVLASANASEQTGTSVAPGTPLETVLTAASMTRLRNALAGDPRDANPLALELSNLGAAHGIVHRTDGLLVLEIEPAADDPLKFRTAYRRLVRQFDRLRRAESLEQVADAAASELARLTGFDRVMVYQFDRHANGSVIAEQRADENMESFLGLHYPASDIPPQARQLYIENPIRLIVDTDFRPVPLVPDVNPETGKPIDLSQSTLRSVSPIHCEYLRNMGVGASMSISLLNGNNLWGLIACHHRTSFLVPYGTRMVAEFLAHVLSAKVLEIERTSVLMHKARAYSIQSRLIDQMVAASSFEEGLAADYCTLTDLFPSDGAAILYRGQITTVGKTPTVEQVRTLSNRLSTSEPTEVVATESLAATFPAAAEYAAVASGAIVVPLSADGSDRIFWFRGERGGAITWAGDPEKSVVVDSEDRLRPRSSFAAFRQQVRHHCEPWQEWEIDIASDFRTAIAASVIHQAAELERLNARLMQASQHKDHFLATVSHELRNPLNAIVGWVRVARMGLDGDELEHALETIERNAEAQTELINDLLDVSRIQSGNLRLETEVVNFREIMLRSIETVQPSAWSRGIKISSSCVEETANVVADPRRLQQIIWNLLNNAIKFSNENSEVRVSLERISSSYQLEVADDGFGMTPELLSKVFEPFTQGDNPESRAGLGLGLSIVKSIVELHDGEIVAYSDGPGHGAIFRVRIPVATLAENVASGDSVAKVADFDLAGRRVLVVEDHADAGQMVVRLIEAQGASVDYAGNGNEAMKMLLGKQCYDLIISDLDMPEMDGFELIDRIRRDSTLTGLPAIALTAFTRGGDRARALRAGFQYHVAKPVDPDELLAVVATLLSRVG